MRKIEPVIPEDVFSLFAWAEFLLSIKLPTKMESSKSM